MRSGARAATVTLVVHALPTADGHSRAGVIVGRTVGGSVARHRVARQLRAGLAPRVVSLQPCSLVVVRALPAAATAPWQQLESDLDAALRRATAKLGHRPMTASAVSR